jgi:microcystin-dependent protein
VRLGSHLRRRFNALTGQATNVTSIGVTGAGQPHLNMMPSLALSFCINLHGPFPGR